VQLARAKAFPSLNLLRPSGAPSWLRIKGLPKISCLRIFAVLVGVAFVRPGRTRGEVQSIL
jgi:hypothetical protein